MERLLGWCFLLLTAMIVGYMAKQAISGKRTLLCLRNFFLAGLIIFQLTSAAMAFFTQTYGDLPVADPTGTGLMYLFLVSAFTFIFVVVYENGWLTFGIQRRIQMTLPAPGPGMAFAQAIFCLASAALVKFTLGYVPVVTTVAQIYAIALVGVAAGLAAWTWASNPRNMVSLALFFGIAAAACSIAIFENFGRRSLVSVLFACLWGIYHGGLRHVNLKKTALPMIVFGVGGFLLVAAFTATRGVGDTEHGSFTNRLGEMLQADLGDGIAQLIGGQDSATNSLWIIENRPEPYPYDTLHSLRYFLVHPVPRGMWENKPTALGTSMVTQSMLQGRGEGFSLGPGLMGHIFNDNPWLALPLYAALLAAWLRVQDDLLKRYASHPYMVLPAGVALGNILGLARGELGLFLFEAFWGIASAYFGTIVVAWVLRSMGLIREAPAPEHEALDEDAGAAYQD